MSERTIKSFVLDIKEELSKQFGRIIDPPDEEIIIDALKFYIAFLKGADLYGGDVEN